MTKIDVSDLLIRVILNRTHYDRPTKQHPFDMEGTVLHILPHEDRVRELIAQGGLIDILCNPDVDSDMAVIMVRWDNDQRTYVYAGSLIFRRGLVSICNSLWESSGIVMDHRPTDQLMPDTGGVSPKSTLPKKFTGGLIYSDPKFVPNDGKWHPCYANKTSNILGRAMAYPGGNVEFVAESKKDRYTKDWYQTKFGSKDEYNAVKTGRIKPRKASTSLESYAIEVIGQEDIVAYTRNDIPEAIGQVSIPYTRMEERVISSIEDPASPKLWREVTEDIENINDGRKLIHEWGGRNPSKEPGIVMYEQKQTPSNSGYKYYTEKTKAEVASIFENKISDMVASYTCFVETDDMGTVSNTTTIGTGLSDTTIIEDKTIEVPIPVPEPNNLHDVYQSINYDDDYDEDED